MDTVAPALRHCFGAGHLRHDPSRFTDVASAQPTLVARFSDAPPPYVFAVPTVGLADGTYGGSVACRAHRVGCQLPRWFELNLLSTKVAQAADARGEAGAVVLVEGPLPYGVDFCEENGIVHYSVPGKRHFIYRSLMEQVTNGSLGTLFKTNSDTPSAVGSSNLWLLSVIRYFFVHDFVRASQVARFVYVDWDTVVYIPSAAAWRILAAADPPIRMAAGTGNPPYATANHMYTAWTNESLADYVGYVAAQVSLEMPPGCGPDSAALSPTSSSGPAGGTQAYNYKADINGYSDMLQLFWYSMHAHRHSMRSPYDPYDVDWLREMPTLEWEEAQPMSKRSGDRGRGDGRGGARGGTGGGDSAGASFAFVRCDDSNIACDEHSRWHVPPASSPFGAKFPPWHAWAPRHRVFNLYEPFGNGHVIADMPVEGTRTRGTTMSGYKNDRVGVSSLLADELFEYIGSGDRRAKRFVWGGSPGLLYCAPFSSVLRPLGNRTPLWGWFNAVPAAELAMALPKRELGEPTPEGRERRYFRNWAVTFSTPVAKERLLPKFLLVDEKGQQVPCSSKQDGGPALYRALYVRG
jgi:hypothetical protein